jgi:hypothetical protein
MYVTERMLKTVMVREANFGSLERGNERKDFTILRV